MSRYLFLRAMASPLSTQEPTAGGLLSNCVADARMDMPNSFTAQKEKRLLALKFSCCLPLDKNSVRQEFRKELQEILPVPVV